METFHNKRSVSFASVVLDSLGNIAEHKLPESKKMGKGDISFRQGEKSLGIEGVVLPLLREEHCISNNSADWKIRYAERVVNKKDEDEEFHILQRAAAFPAEATPKRKREVLVADTKELQFEARTVKRQKTTTSFIAPIEQAQNSLICKVYLLDQKSLVNRWRRLVVPSSTYCQAVVDAIADSFDIEVSSTFYAKRQFSDKYVFKGGPIKKSIKHAMLVPISDLNLEAGDGLDILYGTVKLNFRVEYVRDSFSLKYNSEPLDSQMAGMSLRRGGVYIVGGSSDDTSSAAASVLTSSSLPLPGPEHTTTGVVVVVGSSLLLRL